MAQDQLFLLEAKDGRQIVTANRSGVPADEALRKLATAMGWGVQFETEALRSRMSVFGVDVALDRQSPRTVAHLLAVAGGADVVFSDASYLGEQTTTMMVVSPPTNETESGRQRLRQWAIQWYTTFLQDKLRHDPLVEEHGMDVRMNMARLLRDQGALEEAALVYHELETTDPTHDFVPMALLELAECRFELGEEHWVEAERVARDLMKRHPSLAEAAQGTVLLGRILLAQGRHQECARTLTAAYLRLAGTPEIIDLYLLVARAEYHLGDAETVLSTTSALDEAHEFRELSEEQWLDYLFLRGYGLHATGENEKAVEPLEIFLGMGAEDPRRGIAFVLLGRTYLALDRIVEARAAAIEAHHLKVGGRVDGYWGREASKFYAKTALEIGDREEAFEKLEVEVRRSPESEPELVLYLGEAFMGEGRFQKAIITAELLVDLDGKWGDAARMMRLEATWRQSMTAGGTSLRTFPERALPLVDGIEGKEHLQRVSEIFGQAYELNGDIQKAADAYRGMLR